MNNQKQNSTLMAIGAFCVVASLILCGLSMHFTRVIRAAQDAIRERDPKLREIQMIQFSRQSSFRELSRELTEYSKRNPDVLRLLQPPAPAKAPAPAPKKPAK
jgi:hypothetical protein